MSEKTILKLHANGDFETVDVELQQLENLFVKHTCVRGWIDSSGILQSQEAEQEWASDYIAVTEGDYALQSWWEHVNNNDNSYITVCIYGENKIFLERVHRFLERGVPYHERVFTFSREVKFVRIAVGFLATFGKAQFIKGDTPKPYTLSTQDLIEQGLPLYSFTQNEITVPTIIKMPPTSYRNYFIESTMVQGFLDRIGNIGEQTEGEITSDFINVSGWNDVTIRIRYENMNDAYRAWRRIAFFTSTKNSLQVASEGYLDFSVGDSMFESYVQVPLNAEFLRVSTNYYQIPNVTVKISVEKGTPTNTKHYPSFEDMPSWVKDTGNPISIFPQGIVIKGDLIHTITAPNDIVFSDNFNRSNSSTLGGIWKSLSGGLEIVDNKVKPTTLNTNNVSVVDIGLSDNLSIECVITPESSDGIVFRQIDIDNHLHVFYEIGFLILRSRENGVNSNEALALNLPKQTFTLKVELRNTEIKVFINGELKTTKVSNKFINGTEYGIKSWSNTVLSARFDDFTIKRLLAPTPEAEPEQPVSRVLFTDDFNRTDSNTLGENWIDGRGSWGIENNRVKPINSDSIALCVHPHGDNVSISADVMRVRSDGIIFRGRDANNHLYVQFEIADFKLKSLTNGVVTTLKTFNLNSVLNRTYRVRIELRDIEIKVFVDDVLCITHETNVYLNNNLCGFQSWSQDGNNGRFDNFIVEKLPINE